jgi:hypothetical protein
VDHDQDPFQHDRPEADGLERVEERLDELRGRRTAEVIIGMAQSAEEQGYDPRYINLPRELFSDRELKAAAEVFDDAAMQELQATQNPFSEMLSSWEMLRDLCYRVLIERGG